LVRNAGEAIGAASAGSVRVEAHRVSGNGDAPRIAITVRDDGPGLAPGAPARGFEPDFSTKGGGIATRMGAGLGGGVVESAGGCASVESHPGAGATFTLALPSAEPKPRRTSLLRAPLRTAAISIPDVRAAALATMILQGLDMTTFRHDDSTSPAG